MKTKQRTITGKQFIRQVADTSGYNIYEIEDIVKAIAICIAENAKMQYNVSVKGIGSFRLKKGYRMQGKSNITGEMYDVETKDTLSFKIDTLLSNMINDIKGETE